MAQAKVIMSQRQS